ncbi:phosphatidylglycerophosphatase A family protein [Psychromonas algicola]|uniref:phosphatidylglycerophosphatase A family protein n=1 Tax=Psychromonas algicola TaxID=2555642 RepID=UPI0010678B84|nr:phosphatidylglycerophosphatase A [Psychromonas sp. RZ5]TEW49855.1 phosphatidylglycerophosphatase A [Psychromonas sp. RZ5]
MLNRDDLDGLKLSNPMHLAAVGFGSGLAPVAPGTFGTLAAIPFFYFLALLSIEWYVAVLIVTSVAGFWFCHVTSEAMGVHDHKSIVWDEFVGYWITMLPVLIIYPSIQNGAAIPFIWVAVGFALFRFFDVLKPFPISWLDKKVAGGFGIMIDDIVAGIFAALVLAAMLHYWG